MIANFNYNTHEFSQTVSHFRIEKHRVPKAIAVRKAWKKYGQSAGDKPGPNPATTINAEDVSMQVSDAFLLVEAFLCASF